MGLGQDSSTYPEENCLTDHFVSMTRHILKGHVEINDLTQIQRLSVQCPLCAAAPKERCCEIRNGAFRQEEHFVRLLLAAGQQMPSLMPGTSPDRLPAPNQFSVSFGSAKGSVLGS